MKPKSHYCENYFRRERFITREVNVGSVGVGGDIPIRIQSMTTTDTLDTVGSVEQSIRMIEAGCEIVRLTAPSKKEAQNLEEIKKSLVDLGFHTPLVADIHFTPNAAEIAAKYVEKVRINPGNFADKKRFEEIEYTDESYREELKRIEERFTPLVLQCKELGRAMRIGTNHGSLSDRILSRYGDTPEGMVESAMEFIRICAKNNFHDIIISMKASNTIVMVEAYRLLVARMKDEQMNYPLHLGVTEAGEGEDGRIKSAVGIGALLEDGLGDTIRVSLTEAPEEEIPVAQKLVEKFRAKSNLYQLNIPDSSEINYNPYDYERRASKEIINIGDHHVPVVFADLSHVSDIKPSHFFGFGYNYSVPLDKWNFSDQAADCVYLGSNELTFEIPESIHIVIDINIWKEHYSNRKNFFPLVLSREDLQFVHPDDIFFLVHKAEDPEVNYLKNYPNAIVVCETNYDNKTQLYRFFRLNIANSGLSNPVILKSTIDAPDMESAQLWASSDHGASFIDGFGDGLWLKGDYPTQFLNSLSFGILQATRTRISKTEYISCPSCGRTLFDLQETTAKIRERTSHLKGVKIGIMGCIVNGPGEMADADYGYVGSGPGKIHLYKEHTIIRKNIPEENAVDELISLIKEYGDWVEGQ